MKLSRNLLRGVFYSALIVGGLLLCGLLTSRGWATATSEVGMRLSWIVGLCCLIPIVLGGIALAKESQ
jgi:hypothetical protein